MKYRSMLPSPIVIPRIRVFIPLLAYIHFRALKASPIYPLILKFGERTITHAFYKCFLIFSYQVKRGSLIVFLFSSNFEKYKKNAFILAIGYYDSPIVLVVI